MMYPICKNCKNCKIMPPRLAASSFLSQAYPIMSATMRSSSGCCQAEAPEGERLAVERLVERWIESAVGAAVDVDGAPLVDVWVALLRYPLPVPGAFHKRVVSFAVAYDYSS